MKHSDQKNRPEEIQALVQEILLLEKKLEQSELSLRLLEEAKDRYDHINHSTIHRLVVQKAELDRKNKELTDAIKEIKILKGIIPICCVCKNIRDDKGYWNQLEAYIQEHSDAEFSHGICKECASKLYPEIKFKDD
ncbi:MAG: hypothetical protein ABIJ31_10995 [Pseudomonadota bacterium]